MKLLIVELLVLFLEYLNFVFMPCIQVDVQIPPHLHKKLAVHAAKAEAFKSEVIVNALNHYQYAEDVPNPCY